MTADTLLPKRRYNQEYPSHPEIRCHIPGLPKSVIIRTKIAKV